MPTLLEDIRNWFRSTDSGEDITLAPAADASPMVSGLNPPSTSIGISRPDCSI